MKTTNRIVLPLVGVLLLSGGVFLLFRADLETGARPSPPRAVPASGAASTRQSAPGTKTCAAPNAETGPVTAPAVSMAELTQGAEQTANVSEADAALTATLTERLESLTPAQRRAVFAAATRQLNLLTEAEVKARSSDDPEKRRAMLLVPALVGLLQRTDPTAVLAWTVDPGGAPWWMRKASRMAAETLGVYAKTDPAGALAWARENAARLTEPERAWNATLAGLALSDLSQALQVAGERGLTAGALEHMVPALTTPAARGQWVAAVTAVGDPAVRARNWSGLVRDQALGEGWESALATLRADLPAEALTSENLRAVSKEALGNQPGKFADALAALPGDTASEAMPDFIGRWTERDYNAAATWLRDAPSSAAWRDAAVEAMARKIAPLDPEAARAWTATITAPAARARLAGP